MIQDDPIATDPTVTSDPWTQADLDAATQYYTQLLAGHQDVGTVDDGVNAYLRQRRAGLGHDQALQAGTSSLGWDHLSTPKVDPTTPTPTGGAGSSAGAAGSLTTPFSTPFVAPDPVNLGGPAGIPFIPPTPTFTPPTFTPPTADEALQDPGYAFRLDQGNKQLQNWAAAKGTLNDSSTANALQDYGQNAASQEYQNVWGRNFNAYGANLKSWEDSTLQPALLGYSTQAAAGQRANEMNFGNAWARWLQDWNTFRDQRDSTFNHQFAVATA